MDKIRKDKNDNIFNLFLISLSLLPKKVLLFSFDFYKKSLFILIFDFGHFPVVTKSLFILTFDFGHFPVVTKSLFILTFDFGHFPSAPVVLFYFKSTSS